MLDIEFLTHYKAKKDLLNGKVILITGAGRGIGRSVALACARHGATVILCGRTVEKLNAVYDEIEAAGWPQAAIFPVNFESAGEADFQALATAIENEFGQLDGLLHNAAELGQCTPLDMYHAPTWQKVMQVNVNAPFLLTKALLPLLRKSTSASIIFTGDEVGLKGRAYWGAYAISKAALENMRQILADELDGVSAIRVNSINPGPVRTDLRTTAFPGEDPNSLPAPDDVVMPYLFLLGADSQLITGEQIDIKPLTSHA